MDFKELVKKRYSVRKFEDKKVEKEKIEEVLETARFAPSAHNKQSWRFVVVTEGDMLDKVRNCYEKAQWIKKAPAVIVALANKKEAWIRDDGKNHSDIDAAIIIDHITLTAASKGLGTCWVCDHNPTKCSEVLGLPEHLEPVALIPIGYPKYETAQSKPRKELDEIVSWEGYEEK